MDIILIYDDLEINTKIIISNKKTISVEVTTKAELIVRAGKKYSKKKILELLDGKREWIIEKVKYIKDKNQEIIDRKLENGTKLYYLAKVYILEIHKKENKTDYDYLDINLKKIKIYLDGKYDEGFIKKQIEKLYKNYGKQYIEKRVEYFNKFFVQKYKSISIKSQKRIWGSCTSDNRLSFNWKIMMADKEIVDYLVIHEMCHMPFKNHSRNFWSAVGKIIPDYKEKRIWLKENGFRLEL